MNLKIILIAFVLSCYSGCVNDDLEESSIQDDSTISTLNGTWKVISYEDYGANTVDTKTQQNSLGLDIIISFDDTSAPHKMSGKNTTNTISGEFEYSGSRKFIISNYLSTEIAQPVWADKFNEAILDGELNYEINNSRLRIYYESNTKSMTLSKE